ncbi:MAG: hypothetical protein ACYSU0_07825, partial [Planctomycetota bacterium]
FLPIAIALNAFPPPTASHTTTGSTTQGLSCDFCHGLLVFHFVLLEAMPWVLLGHAAMIGVWWAAVRKNSLKLWIAGAILASLMIMTSMLVGVHFFLPDNVAV